MADEWISEGTAQALTSSIDALTERLGEVARAIHEDSPVGSALVRRQESQQEIADALRQLAAGSVSPELVRIAASLDQVKPKIPDLEYIGEGLTRLLALGDELRPIIAALDAIYQNLVPEVEGKLQALRDGTEAIRAQQREATESLGRIPQQVDGLWQLGVEHAQAVEAWTRELEGLRTLLVEELPKLRAAVRWATQGQ
jgi:ABC-type transporter Mla subunit MlaD